MKTINLNRIIGFNRSLFILLFGVFSLLTIVTLIAAAAEDEGTIGTNKIWLFLAKLFYIFRFPTHTLLWPLIGIGGLFTFLGGLIINCMFWALTIERLIFLIKHKENPFKLKSLDAKKSNR